MNSLSPYHSNSTDVLFKRFRLWKRQYLHVVIYTSLFWIFIDVFFIMIFSDCTKEIIVPCCSTSSLRSIKNDSRVLEANIPPARPNPRILLDRFKSTEKTTTTSISSIQKWWDVKPGLFYWEERQSCWFENIGATNPPSWHGEGGRAVAIPQELQEESKKRFTENQFNILASDLIALNRSIRDQRSPKFDIYFCQIFFSILRSFRCHSHTFPDDLPTTSIVIVFHNEGNSTILRTLTSIILRSPIKYIREIILVDDASIGRG